MPLVAPFTRDHGTALLLGFALLSLASVWIVTSGLFVQHLMTRDAFEWRNSFVLSLGIILLSFATTWYIVASFNAYNVTILSENKNWQRQELPPWTRN